MKSPVLQVIKIRFRQQSTEFLNSDLAADAAFAIDDDGQTGVDLTAFFDNFTQGNERTANVKCFVLFRFTHIHKLEWSVLRTPALQVCKCDMLNSCIHHQKKQYPLCLVQHVVQCFQPGF